MTPRRTGTDLEGLVASQRLQRVPVSTSQARRLLAQAHAHLASAALLADTDAEGAYALTYDAARKSLVALLESRGLRPAARGGHVVVGEAALLLLPDQSDVLRPFDRIRRQRHAVEYPKPDGPRIESSDVASDGEKVARSIALVERSIEPQE